MIDKAKGYGIPIFVFGVAFSWLVFPWMVSADTGGLFFYEHDSEEIEDSMSLVTSFLNNIYILEWESDAFENLTIKTTQNTGEVLEASP